MRTNIQSWNSLTLDGTAIDDGVEFAAWAILEKHLGPARGLAELGLFWILSGEKRARPSRVLDVRHYPMKRKIMCRMMVAPTARTRAARSTQVAREMARLMLEVIATIETRLAGAVDLSRVARAIERDMKRLAERGAKARVRKR